MDKVREEPNEGVDVEKEKSREEHNEHLIHMNDNFRDKCINEKGSGEDMNKVHEEIMSESVDIANGPYLYEK